MFSRLINQKERQLLQPQAFSAEKPNTQTVNTKCPVQSPGPFLPGTERSCMPTALIASHFLNGCLNFKELTKEQNEAWIHKNNQCWRCGRNHHASQCTLKVLCKTCNRKHPLILHDLNKRAVSASTVSEPPENSCLVSTTKDILYVDCSASSSRVLLKVSKVIITNGDASLETYAVLGDGSEKTILLHACTQELNQKT